MPLEKVRIKDISIDTLRDIGCSGIVVKKAFVSNYQYTSKFIYVLLIDNIIQRITLSKIKVDTPYLIEGVELMFVYDIVVT